MVFANQEVLINVGKNCTWGLSTSWGKTWYKKILSLFGSAYKLPMLLKIVLKHSFPSFTTLNEFVNKAVDYHDLGQK